MEFIGLLKSAIADFHCRWFHAVWPCYSEVSAMFSRFCDHDLAMRTCIIVLCDATSMICRIVDAVTVLPPACMHGYCAVYTEFCETKFCFRTKRSFLFGGLYGTLSRFCATKILSSYFSCTVTISLSLSLSLSVCLSVCVSVCLCVCLSVCPDDNF